LQAKRYAAKNLTLWAFIVDFATFFFKTFFPNVVQHKILLQNGAKFNALQERLQEKYYTHLVRF